MALESSTELLRGCLASAGLDCDASDQILDTIKYLPGDDYTVNKLTTAAALVAACASANSSGSEARLTTDAFQRLRTSNPQTLFDSKQIFDEQPAFWDDQETQGAGTSSTHSVNRAATEMAVGNVTEGRRIRQTYMRFNYQPGKSQLILMTGIIRKTGGGAGIFTSIGQYDDDNGVFFLMDQGTMKFVRRTNVTGVATDTETVLSDTLEDGTIIDWTKTHIFWFDYEWLGVGKIRAGIVIDGQFVVLHTEDGANTLDAVYMSTPNLPLRYEIYNNSSGGVAAMEHICSTVISEGGSEDLGVIRSASTNGTHLNLPTENTFYAVIGLKLKATHIGASVKLIDFALQEQAGTSQAEWALMWNPSYNGVLTFAPQTDSAVGVAVGDGSQDITGEWLRFAGGFLESGAGVSGNAGSIAQSLENALLLGSTISGVRDELILAVKPIGGSTNIDIEAALTWREIS